MKTLVSTLFVAASLLVGSSSFAAVWRVNNSVVVNANFTTVLAAVNAAAIGDTIYVEGSPASYGSVTLTKQLTLIGTGYFISENDTTQALNQASLMTSLTFNNGSQGTIVTGIQFNSSSTMLNINIDEITIDRCFLNWTCEACSGAAVSVASGRNNTIIRRSFIYRATNTTCCSGNRLAVDLVAGSTNTLIENNIIKNGNKTTLVTSYDSHAIRMGNTATAIIRNNTIMGVVRVFNSIYNNNIHIIGTFIPENMIQVIHNLGNTNQYGTDNGNQTNVVMNDVFEYGPGGENIDNHYILKAGSPAIGAGVSGADAGATGGTSPYYLSGMPAIPAIFEATIPNIVTTASGININTKIKAHD